MGVVYEARDPSLGRSVAIKMVLDPSSAIASGGACVMNDEIVEGLQIAQLDIAEVLERETQELERRERAYRGWYRPLEVRDRTVILVDDGVATGSTMRAAVKGLKSRAAARIVVAAPVASIEACEALAQEADEIVCPMTPEALFAIGLWYEDFAQTSDDEVRALLDAAREPPGSHAPAR